MSAFNNFTKEELTKHLSQFLVSSWSYSAVGTFSRNPKAYEMQYVYGYRSKSSATTVAGNAYHEALQHYFNMMKTNEALPELVDLETIAFNYIEEVDPREWKLQKTVPSIEECIKQSSATASKLIQNFLKDIAIYIEEIEEILDVEHYGKGIFVAINGVDIPLPLYYKTDLIVKLKNGKVAIIDHKSKQSYTPEEDIKLAHGKQAIVYIKGYEAETGLKVDEVWFIENKYSQNRDKTPQLVKFVLDMSTEDVRKYYEAMLYEGLRALVHAVNDPDYVYVMNDSDNLVDLAEMYEFWTKTLLSEVEDFTGVDPTKTDLIKKRLKKIKDTGIKTVNPKVIKQFRQNAAEFIQYDYSNKDMTEEEKIEHVLRRFGTIVKVAKKFDGYSSNTYLLQIDAGTKITSIQSHKLDLANALDVSTVRISKELIVYEGKSYLAVELSKKRERDLLFTKKDLVDMKIPIGRDNYEQVVYWDLDNHSTPHALFCGATGSGKSVSLKSTIEFAKLAKVKHIIILDPKFEFCRMGIKGVQIISEIEDIELALEQLVVEMNERVKSGSEEKTLIVFDEFADAQSQGRKGKELDIMEMVEVGQQKVKGIFGDTLIPKMKLQKTGTKKTLEENLRILAQKGRSVGFRIAAATQRASVKIISGDAKANFPVQICFRVPKEIDSKVVLDEGGAESLAGAGDGLIKSPEYPELVRFQAYFSK
ncbi:MAG: DNA translocase FtsK [Culicoidibacterales bacterium]